MEYRPVGTVATRVVVVAVAVHYGRRRSGVRRVRSVAGTRGVAVARVVRRAGRGLLTRGRRRIGLLLSLFLLVESFLLAELRPTILEPYLGNEKEMRLQLTGVIYTHPSHC